MMTLGVWGLSRGECQMRLLFSSRAPTKILSAYRTVLCHLLFEGGICDDAVGGAEVSSCEADAPDVPSWTQADSIQCGAFATIFIVENSLVMFVFF